MRQAADKVHPGKIVGPSINQFDFGFLQAFVNFSVAHDVVPDILDWHELQPDSVSSTSQHHTTMRQWLSAHHPTLADFWGLKKVPKAVDAYGTVTFILHQTTYALHVVSSFEAKKDSVLSNQPCNGALPPGPGPLSR